MSVLNWFFGRTDRTPWECRIVYDDESTGHLEFWAVDGIDALAKVLSLMPARQQSIIRFTINPWKKHEGTDAH